MERQCLVNAVIGKVKSVEESVDLGVWYYKNASGESACGPTAKRAVSSTEPLAATYEWDVTPRA